MSVQLLHFQKINTEDCVKILQYAFGFKFQVLSVNCHLPGIYINTICCCMNR
jgi:hypothetical protein